MSYYINIYNTRKHRDRNIQLVKESTYNYEGVGDGNFTLADSPEKAAKIFEYAFDASKLPQEYFWLMTLDGARRVNGLFEVTRGTLLSSLVHPREVFSRGLLANAASIIIAHNHPSGMLDISEQDREVTRRIRNAGEILGIRLDDHIIIASDGDDSYNFVSAF